MKLVIGTPENQEPQEPKVFVKLFQNAINGEIGLYVIADAPDANGWCKIAALDTELRLHIPKITPWEATCHNIRHSVNGTATLVFDE